MILLTGATGFLGSHILRALLSSGNRVVILKRSFSNTHRITDLRASITEIDLDRTDSEEAFLLPERIDTVIHCATDYGRRAIDPYQIVEANIILPLRLLHLARKHGCRRFINTDTILDKRVSHYSLSKSQFVSWLMTYADSLVCVNMSLEHFFGPGDDPSKFVPYILNALLSEVSEIPLTRGEQRRHFVYIDDVVAAFRCVIEHTLTMPAGYYPYQVGTPQAVSIREFVELAQRLTGNHRTQLDFGALPYRENEVMCPNLDLSALCDLGWRPQVALYDGMVQTIAHDKGKLKQCTT